MAKRQHVTLRVRSQRASATQYIEVALLSPHLAHDTQILGRLPRFRSPDQRARAMLVLFESHYEFLQQLRTVAKHRPAVAGQYGDNVHKLAQFPNGLDGPGGVL